MLFFELIGLCLSLVTLVTGVPTNHRLRRESLDLSGIFGNDNSSDGEITEPDSDPHTGLLTCQDRCLHGTCIDHACECNEGWTGFSCQSPCTLKCQHGICKYKPEALMTPKLNNQITEEEMFCSCFHGYYNEYCSEEMHDRVDEADDNNQRLAIILGTCLSVVVVAGIIIPLALWFRQGTFCKRTSHLAKMYKESDCKSFDVYISYPPTSNAVQFVTEHLAPWLSHRGFQLYTPRQGQQNPDGENENEGIMASFKLCRRTILLITRDCLSTKVWQNLDAFLIDAMNVELEEQIIPVLLEDVKCVEIQEMPQSLQHFLMSMKCLEVPKCWASSSTDTSEKMSVFWNRLEMAMPKKKHVAD